MAEKAKLVLTRYVPPGTYIGTIMRPDAGVRNDIGRIPCFIGKTSRLFKVVDFPLRRSFINKESLIFSSSEPFIAPLKFQSNGAQDSPVKLYKSDSTELDQGKWIFTEFGSQGEGTGVLISPDSFEEGETYYINYQSTDRDVQDDLPREFFENLRSLKNISLSTDSEQYKEYRDFFIPIEFGTYYRLETSQKVTDIKVDDSEDGMIDGELSSYTENYLETADTRSHQEVELEVIDASVKTAVVLAYKERVPEYSSLALPGYPYLDDPLSPNDLSGRKTITIDVDSAPALSILNGNLSLNFKENNSTLVNITEFTDYSGTVAGTVAIEITTHGLVDDDYIKISDSRDYKGKYKITKIDDDNFYFTATYVTLVVKNITEVSDYSGTIAGSSLITSVGHGLGEVSESVDVVISATTNYDGPQTAVIVDEDTFYIIVAFVADETGTFTLVPDIGKYAKVVEDLFYYVDGDKVVVDVAPPPFIEQDDRYNNDINFPKLDFIETSDNIDDIYDGDSTAVGESVVKVDIHKYSIKSNARIIIRVVDKVTGIFSYSMTNQFGFTTKAVQAEDYPSVTPTGWELDLEGIEFIFPDSSLITDDQLFYLKVQSPKIFTSVKDPRSIKLLVATNPNVGVMDVSYSTNTYEGSFGIINDVISDMNNQEKLGLVEFQGNLRLFYRNMEYVRINDSINFGDFGDNHALTIDTVDSKQSPGNKIPVMNWSLNSESKLNVTYPVFRDGGGNITGTPGSKYIILDNIPIKDTIYISDSTFTSIEGTSYIIIDNDTLSEIEVESYQYVGSEPLPSQEYFVTSYVVRPDNQYNIPVIFSDFGKASEFLAPSTTDNDLYIMNELVKIANPREVCYILVKDGDEDGYYTKNDYEIAVDSSIKEPTITDKIIIGAGEAQKALSRLLLLNVEDCNPLNKRLSNVWVGMGKDEDGNQVKIGDVNTPDTLVYMAKKTLAVFGDSHAHGRRRLVGSTYATKSIRMDTKNDVDVELDGSFIAGYTAAYNASFDDPKATLLKKQVAGFDTMQVYERDDNDKLGRANILYFQEIGDGLYQYVEDLTVDTFSQHFNIISSMNQTDFVKWYLIAELDQKLIGYVPTSVADGIAQVKVFIFQLLDALIIQGKMSPMQDDDGNNRAISADTDVLVEVDKLDKTLYYFWYKQFPSVPIKRNLGMLAVNSNDFSVS